MTPPRWIAVEREITRFRAWAAGPDRLTNGEWETYYPNWNDLYNAVTDYIRGSQVEEWDNDVADLLLYAIARDNECELIANTLRDCPEKVYRLAAAAVQSNERDAKWQLAEQLIPCPDREAAERLLLTFAADADEYVRRRALMALGRMQSSHVERLAEEAWSSADEYQRMAVLDALSNVRSGKLGSYLAMAEADDRAYLTAFARQIRQRTELAT